MNNKLKILPLILGVTALLVCMAATSCKGKTKGKEAKVTEETVSADEQTMEQIKSAEKKLLDLSTWLTGQGLDVRIKVATARNTAEGIVDEVNNDGYLVVFLMKRKIAESWKRLFTRSVSERVIRSANCLIMIATLEQL